MKRTNDRDNEERKPRKVRAPIARSDEIDDSESQKVMEFSDSNNSIPLDEGTRGNEITLHGEQEQQVLQNQQILTSVISAANEQFTSTSSMTAPSLLARTFQHKPANYNYRVTNLVQLHGLPLPNNNSDEALINDLLLRYGGGMTTTGANNQLTEEARLHQLLFQHHRHISIASQLESNSMIAGSRINSNLLLTNQLDQFLALQEALQLRSSLESLQQQHYRQQYIPLNDLNFRPPGTMLNSHSTFLNDNNDRQMQQQRQQNVRETSRWYHQNNRLPNINDVQMDVDVTQPNNLTHQSSVVEPDRASASTLPPLEFAVAQTVPANDRKLPSRPTASKSNKRSLPSLKSPKTNVTKSSKKLPVDGTNFIPDNMRDLCLPSDQDNLSEYQCLLRQQIVLFSVSEPDIQCSAQGRNRPITLGQVGVLCKYCARITPGMRPSGSVYFPSKLSGLYQASQNMAINHFSKSCLSIPESVRQRLLELKERKSTVLGGGKIFWANGAKILGVIEYDDQLRFDEPPDVT